MKDTSVYKILPLIT